ncbi:MAG: hypothetical protein ACTHJN_03625 [Ginsengibacter sp.]
MKKYSVFYFVLFITILSVILPQCKKHPSRLNITLYNQPLPVIKKYISGKWKLEYSYGGYIANLRTDFHDKDYIWQIDGGVNIKQTYLGNLVTDTAIEWYPESRYTYVGPTFIMRFYDKGMYPNNYVVIGIVEDSLVLKDFAIDAVTYHFSKQK